MSTRSAFLATESTFLPKPLPLDAPSTIPGRSIIWILEPLYCIIPGTAVSVVNWYDAVREFAFVSALSNVDFPTLGNPTRTTEASPDFRTLNPSFSFPVETFFQCLFSSNSRLSFAIFALRIPIWNSVALFIWVLWISSCRALIFSGIPRVTPPILIFFHLINIFVHGSVLYYY